MNKDLLNEFRAGRVVIFVGGGVSCAVGLPSWSQLIERLERQLHEGEMPLSYTQLDYLRKAQYLTDTYGKKAVTGIIRRELSCRRLPDSEIHQTLVRLPARAFITTNWDTLIEDHFEKILHLDGNCVYRDEDLGGIANTPWIIKYHGDIKDQSSYVFTEDDYYHFMNKSSLLQNLVQSLVSTSTLLFLGYGFNDIDFKLLFNQIKQILGDLKPNMYIFSPYADELERDYLKNRGLTLLQAEKGQDELKIFLNRLSIEVSLSAVDPVQRCQIMLREHKRILNLNKSMVLLNMSNLGPLATPEKFSNQPLHWPTEEQTSLEIKCASNWRKILQEKRTKAKCIVCLDPKWIISQYDPGNAIERLTEMRNNIEKYRDRLEIVDTNSPVSINIDIYGDEVCMEGEKYTVSSTTYHRLSVRNTKSEIQERKKHFETLFLDTKNQNSMAASGRFNGQYNQLEYIEQRIDNAIAACQTRKVLTSTGIIGVCWIYCFSCNMHCPVCYSHQSSDERDERVDNRIRRDIIDKLCRCGVRKISFGGGEPLLGKDIALNLAYAKGKGFKTGLCTNGKLLDKDMCDQFAPYLDEITLPLDGSTDEIHKMHRGGDNHYDKVLECIEQTKNCSIATDVSTVLTSKNLEDMPNILRLLNRLSIKKWKVFQFYPLEGAKIHMEDFIVHKRDYNRLKSVLKNIAAGDIEIDFRDDSSSAMRSYLNLTPKGDILLVNDDKYERFENILDVSNLREYLDSEKFNFNDHRIRHRRDI